MDLDIKGLRVLVTAGAGGIGLAITRRFASEGARVHTCDVDETALSALAASDPAITATRCDVSDRSAVKNLFAEALTKLGGLDVLVNNAGVSGPTAPVQEVDPDQWEQDGMGRAARRWHHRRWKEAMEHAHAAAQ